MKTIVALKHKIEPFNDMAWYGNLKIFKKRLQEGFSEFAFGRGQWVGGERIVGIFVFYHPDGRIVTLESPKYYDHFHGKKFEGSYSSAEFKKYLKANKISLRQKHSLRAFIRMIAKQLQR